jgi:hypothetical protein
MTTSQAVELANIVAEMREYYHNRMPGDIHLVWADRLAALGSGPDGKMGEAGASGPTETVAVEEVESILKVIDDSWHIAALKLRAYIAEISTCQRCKARADLEAAIERQQA